MDGENTAQLSVARGHITSRRPLGSRRTDDIDRRLTAAAESRPLLMLGYWQRLERAVMRVSRGRGGVDG